ncbi:MAG: hypothetical protein NC548_62385, partial [Lachnospiraceae bacterium]|nr:hypothetical protein [Lachnospiraceae bacterium]
MSLDFAIVHDATVVRRFQQRSELEVVVTDSKTEGCASCAAAAICKPSGGHLVIRVPDVSNYKVGEH